MRKNLSEIHALQKQICLHNSKAAFTALFRLFYQSLYHFAMQYMHIYEAAGEVVNDVFVKIWKQRAILLEVQNLEGYFLLL